MKTNILIISVSLFLSLSVYAEGDFQAYLHQAGKAFKAQEVEQALTELKKAEPLASSDIEKIKVKNALGWTHFSEGDNDKATLYLQEALRLAVKNENKRLAEKASNNLGVIEYTAGHLESAEKYFSSQWSNESETGIRYLELIHQQKRLNTVNNFIAQGVVYAIDKRYEAAIAEYNKALIIDTENIIALEYKGYTQYRLENHADAIVTLKKAQAIKPDEINVLINLMKAYCSTQQEEAVKAFIERNKALLISNNEVLKNDGELQHVCDKTLFSGLAESKE
jgi:tetratricopeptide (TPR) repeat protein